MESVDAEVDENKELDDSGYVQDEGPHKLSMENVKQTNLLDLSDDVLLCILSYCRAPDLKALGFSCTRFAVLIRDRSLWHYVDATDRPCGRKRLRWFLDHALHSGTTHLYLKGFAEHCVGCDGYINSFRKEAEEDGDPPDRPSTVQQQRLSDWLRDPQNPLPRSSASPSWPDEDPPRTEVKHPHESKSCSGPHFTLTPCLLRRLSQQCNLTHFQADMCNINCNTTPLSLFPSTLTHLSLRGTRCFNVPNVEKSFLFQIQDHLPHLEYLDLSECTWLEPTCLLPLSKLPHLKRLYMTNCPRMTEFVAYASLAGRYGFRRLQVFDLRGSPIGDSEAAALGWLPELEELYLSSSPAPGVPPPACPPRHQHYKDDALPAWQELCRWELAEPPYFKKVLSQQRKCAKGEEKCFHNLPFYKCQDGFCDGDKKYWCKNLKRKHGYEEPGPSKRMKSEDSDNDDDDEEIRDDDNIDDQLSNSENVVSGENNEGVRGVVNNEGNSDRNDEVNNAIGNQVNDGVVDQANIVEQGNNGAILIIGARGNNRQQPAALEENLPPNNEQLNDGEQRNNAEQPNNGAEAALGGNSPPNNEQPNNPPNNEQPNNGEQQNNAEEQNNEEDNNQNQENIEARPRAQVLYINLGRQNHPIFRAVFPGADIPGPLSMDIRMPASHMPTALISDSAIRSFGNSDDDNVNYFHIGGPPNPQNARPSKSNLRILSVQGYKKITDRSLMHLRTSAPKLEVIDFTETNVTEKGVERFKRRRPDVKVFYSRFVDIDGPLDCRITVDG